MTTYTVTTYQDKATYKVTLDETGVVAVDGLTADTAETLKSSVARYMHRNGLPATTALGLAIGPYSFATEADEEPVSDQASEAGVL